jgi:hypothetical protein
MLQTTLSICNRPHEVAERCMAERSLEPLARTALVLVLVGTAGFGFVLGGARDLSQGAATALKLPLAWILTLAVCAPAFYAISAALGRSLSFRATLALILTSSARASLLLFALLPVFWLFTDLAHGPSQYHRLTFAAALTYGVAGLLGLGILLRAFPKSPRTFAILGSFAVVFFLVSGQTAWSLRPFVGRPAEKESPWLRAPEDTFLDALWRGSSSARGVYTREAPRPGDKFRYHTTGELEQVE